MANWDKDLFINHLREHCTREVAKIGVSIIEDEKKIFENADIIAQLNLPTDEKPTNSRMSRIGQWLKESF